MIPSKLLLLALLATGTPGFVPDATGTSTNPLPVAMAGLFWDPTICEMTALAARFTAEYEAHADFFLTLGKCVNDPLANLAVCIQDALDARQEALDLAEDQYEARLDACEDVGEGAYDPVIEPSQFSATVTNPYFPLVPGRTLVYQKQTPNGLERLEVTTLSQTNVIAGVPCRAVHVVETLSGELVEDTIDWFAQQSNGDVWYFGEIAQNYEDGFLDNLDGSWRAGKDGAKPGIQMLASPAPELAYRQEFLLNEAEDIAEVESIHQTVFVPYGTFHNCVMTEDWTPLEPDNLGEWKFYAAGIGMVLEIDIESGERLELIQIIN